MPPPLPKGTWGLLLGEMSMLKFVVKRTREIQPFQEDKIHRAITQAAKDLESNPTKLADKVVKKVVKRVNSWGLERVHVDQIHVLVENTLMDLKLYEVAKQYIRYRDANKPDIFRSRQEIKPYEYPHLLQYVDAIRHSYWLHSEFSYESDIQDYKVNMSDEERETVKRAMLAISQIESSVKKFWGRLDEKLPKPEISKVGATFSESEVRHEDAYSNLLEMLGLNNEFKDLKNVPCMDSRIKYLEKVNRNIRSTEPREFFETIVLFSMFIENVSLFSQFLILMSFNKHKNQLKGISNAIEATSKEEEIHARFGFDLVNIIKEENPEWFDDDLVEYIKQIAYEAYDAEKEIVEWIYGEGDYNFLQKETVLEYIKNRINQSLNSIGVSPVFSTDPKLLTDVEWFDDEMLTTKSNDFFYKRVTNYAKRNMSITAEDLY